MDDKPEIAILIGSLRQESYNRKLAQAFVQISAHSLDCHFLSIADLSLFNQDEEDHPPAAWDAFRDGVRAANGILFVSPEYNRSIPGVLKNAIDIGSRPVGKSAWMSKPAGVITVSPSKLGGFGSNHHLRQVLTALNMPAMPQPELYIGECQSLFNADGRLTSADMIRMLDDYAGKFAAWVNRFRG